MNDPFLDINRVVDRLYNEHKRYGDIIIAFDFDYTVHNFRDEDYTYERVSEMLRKWQPYVLSSWYLVLLRKNDIPILQIISIRITFLLMQSMRMF